MMIFYQKALGAPTYTSLLKAVRMKWLRSIPWLTASRVRRHYQQLDATAYGHLDKPRASNKSRSQPKLKKKRPQASTGELYVYEMTNKL
ncbi:MAG: hypothetical protein ACKO96_43490, partial [Flammeovirgaceae bacterium]